MAGFKRKVSYIHLYENMKKGKNIGFVKTDIQDGKCRIEVRMNGVYTNGKENCEIYSLIRENDAAKGYFVGDFCLEGQLGSCQFQREEDQVDRFGNQIDRMDGFAFILSENRLALSLFERADPSFHEVWIKDRKYGPNGVAIISKEAEEDLATNEESQSEAVMQVEESEKMENTESLVEMTDSESPAEEKQEDSLNTEKEAADVPVIVPFEDVTGYVFYKIAPDDLAHLAVEYEIMQHNSFLLHGYYNYQYLIIGQKEGDRWILGVPGVYHDREQMMASMFGFPEFKSARKGKITLGTFGYYLKEVRVNPDLWKLH